MPINIQYRKPRLLQQPPLSLPSRRQAIRTIQPAYSIHRRRHRPHPQLGTRPPPAPLQDEQSGLWHAARYSTGGPGAHGADASGNGRRLPGRHGQNGPALSLGRKNALFAGSSAGGESWAIHASLINSAKLKGGGGTGGVAARGSSTAARCLRAMAGRARRLRDGLGRDSLAGADEGAPGVAPRSRSGASSGGARRSHRHGRRGDHWERRPPIALARRRALTPGATTRTAGPAHLFVVFGKYKTSRTV